MSNLSTKLLPISVILIWLCTGFYLSIGAMTRVDHNENLKNIEFNRVELQKDTINRNIGEIDIITRYDRAKFMEIKKQPKLYKWLFKLPNLVGALILACSFGLIGGLVDLVLQVKNNSTAVEDLKYFSTPLLGCFSGIAVLGLSYLIPSLLVSDNQTLKPESLIFLSLFGGIFSKDLFEKVQLNFKKLLS
jgi:hypothetical protein